jgi:hypothetical protein
MSSCTSAEHTIACSQAESLHAACWKGEHTDSAAADARFVVALWPLSAVPDLLLRLTVSKRNGHAATHCYAVPEQACKKSVFSC